MKLLKKSNSFQAYKLSVLIFQYKFQTLECLSPAANIDISQWMNF